ncbi:MAG: LysM peptidoglycan-binding domain-containing protein [Clostridiales bacterium]|jgi:LysM repeat protein|nr:LysM peptidoglycan-binding domain-containing protein [Clostridiales bacterium]
MNFPTNIKQIGAIDSGLKIYVEDYVYSYLKQYSKANDYKESLAVLLGKYTVIDNSEAIFISGAIQGKHTADSNGILTFTDKTWEYMLEQKELYFQELEVIGWMQSQPSYGTYLNAGYANYHLNNFRKPYQVIFVCDPVEKSTTFYAYNKEQTDLVEKKGYFIYFDKNNEMHEYMVSNNIGAKDKMPVKDPTLRYITEKRDQRQPARLAKDLSDWIPEEKTHSKEKPLSLATKEEKEYYAQKKALNLLVSLCVVLFVTSFVMGIGLMNNQDRIANLEENIVTLSTTYRSLAESTEVFAQSNSSAGEGGSLIEENGSEGAATNEGFSENLIDGDTNDENLPEDVGSIIQETTDDLTSMDLPEYYVVQSGDTLLQIAERFYGTRLMAEKIMEHNNIEDANKIISGTRLVLPPRSEVEN